VAGPHAIPVSTGIRAGKSRIVFALGRGRDTLARLRDEPAAAFTVLAEGVAFTAYGRASVIREELESAPHVAALALEVERVEDHLEGSRTELLAAARWRWTEDEAVEDERRILAELRELAPQDPVEIIRSGWSAWLRGDLPALFSLYDPKIVWDTSHFHDWPEPAYYGIEGVERFLTEWLDVWDDYEMGVEEIVAAPDGRVVTLLWHRGRGRDSRAPLELEMAQIATLRDGKVTRLDNYDDRDAALRAAGLGD
jgi:ketosteroid isomerase-like protein